MLLNLIVRAYLNKIKIQSLKFSGDIIYVQLYYKKILTKN
jgi:hypothetical protein